MSEKRRYGHIDDGDGNKSRVLIVRFKDCDGYEVKWTSSCSGCFEFNEGLGLDRYKYDSKAQCYLGSGCEECGYTGKRRNFGWVPMSYDADRYFNTFESEASTLGGSGPSL